MKLCSHLVQPTSRNKKERKGQGKTGRVRSSPKSQEQPEAARISQGTARSSQMSTEAGRMAKRRPQEQEQPGGAKWALGAKCLQMPFLNIKRVTF